MNDPFIPALYNATDEGEGLLTTYSTRKLQAWDITGITAAVNGAIAFANGDGITFNSFGLSLGIKKGLKPTIGASYNLTFGDDTPIEGSFTYNGDADKAANRHLLQMDQFKNLVIDKLINEATRYLKTKFPKLAAFLPKDSECASSGVQVKRQLC